MFGAYLIRSNPLEFKESPVWQSLAAVGVEWSWAKRADGCLFVYVTGSAMKEEAYGAPVTVADGRVWYPPKDLPELAELARENPPEHTTIRLRRFGQVAIPLGLGPVYGCGRKAGLPSSTYGYLLDSIYTRSVDKDHVWCDADDRDVEEVIFLAFSQVYRVTRELFDEFCPYDTDEVNKIFNAMLGVDPKALPGDAA